MSIGLVLEGGGLRGLFTAGVLDVFLENQIVFENAVGVSAGAAFGINLKSQQIGRVLRFNLRYCRDRRYWSFRSLLKTGDIFGADFCYDELTYRLDPFDYNTYMQNPMHFYAVCTNLTTGKPVYHLCPNGTPDDMIWIRASASMPLVSRAVIIDNEPYLDGGISDSIPIRFSESLGYDKNVVIRTKPPEYRVSQQKVMWYVKKVYKKYPKFVEACSNRHSEYNDTLLYLKEREQQGKAFIIQPPVMPEAGLIEKDPQKLQRTYNMGRSVAQEKLESLREFFLHD